MFFEKGELGDALELSEDLPGGLERIISEGRITDKKCPRCSSKLKELPFLKGYDLLIDVCQGCSGIWVDRGEYSKLEALSTEAESFGKRFGKLLKKIDDDGYTILGTA
jgi:Zn-finger nucleic acid-binding protein